jgi:hypothetical protein
METNLVKKGLQSIYGGLQMLSESKPAQMSALAEVSIILSYSEIRDKHQIDDEVTSLLNTMHFLLKDLNPESVKLITDYISNREQEIHSIEPGIDYKSKYEQTLEKLNIAQEELLNLKGVTVN